MGRLHVDGRLRGGGHGVDGRAVRQLRFWNAQPLENMRAMLLGIVGHVGKLCGSDGVHAERHRHAAKPSLRQLWVTVALPQLHERLQLEHLGRVGNLRRPGRMRAASDGLAKYRLRQLRHAGADTYLQHELRLGCLDELGKLQRPGGVRTAGDGLTKYRLRQLRYSSANAHLRDELCLGQLDELGDLHRSGCLRQRPDRKQSLQLWNPKSKLRFVVHLGRLGCLQWQPLFGHASRVLWRSVLQHVRHLRLASPKLEAH
jgi:hypothetical protein